MGNKEAKSIILIQFNGLFAPWRRCSRFLMLDILKYMSPLKKRSRLASEQKSSLNLFPLYQKYVQPAFIYQR